MPLYVFECKACNRTVEVLQRFDDEKPKCADCEKQMKKKPSLTSFNLKGDGWAKDNYGLKNG